MSDPRCSVCGALLLRGVCPNGHPQRAARGREPRERRGRRVFPLLLLLLILGGIAYTTLFWIPTNAAGKLMDPSSRDFADAVSAYRGAANALPPGATDPQVLGDLAASAAAATGPARDELSSASVAIAERRPLDLPVISSREPLSEAIELRARMIEFYATALQAVSGIERTASYLAQASAVLPGLDSLEANLVAADAEAPQDAAGSSIPIADQLISDLQALTPPDELTGLHESLVTIAQRIRDGLDALLTTRGGEITRPVVAATIKSLRDEIVAFRQTFGTAARRARGGGLGPLLEEVDALSVEITERLVALREQHGLDGIELPGQV